MNKPMREKRMTYLELADSIDHLLCTWCKYSSGGCDEQSCLHPLGERLESQWGGWGGCGIEPGCDCYAFRPWASIDLAADITGIVLSEGFNGGWMYLPADDEHPLPMLKGSHFGAMK